MTQRRKRQAKNAAHNSESGGSGSGGDSPIIVQVIVMTKTEDGSKGKDSIGSCFEDEGTRCEVTAFGEDDAGERVLFYNLPTGEEAFFSGV
jgi:hypothetical protein